MIGRVLGEGGFGITYLALDLTSETPVAVKEYFPAGLAARDPVDGGGETLIMLDGERERYFQDGLQKFALEGRNLAKLSRQPGIVTALDFFEANGTAYLVMEYIEGQSLKQYMQWYRKNSNNKSIDYPVAIAFLEPVMKALIEVHRAGLIHRDISPDNILVDKDGKVTLIDFGAARVGVKENELRSMTIMVKHGYAPQEQYRTHGKQGPWTDVYALCATLYHMISGELPVDSIERMDNDELIPLKDLDLPVPVPAVISDILEKGMRVRPTERYQTMEELYRDLKRTQEELGAREKALEKERLERERLEKARFEAEQLEQERLEKARFEAERLEQERQQIEQEGLTKTQTEPGNIQTVAGRSTETVAINGTEKISQNYDGVYSDNGNGGKLPDVHEMLEKFQQQEEILKEKENALKKQEEALKEQERLRLEEQKSRQKKMLYGIATFAAVAVIAGAYVGISHMKSDRQEEPLPATAQIQATEKDRIAETKYLMETEHLTEAEGITETEATNTVVNETEHAAMQETSAQSVAYTLADQLEKQGLTAQAAIAFGELGDYEDAASRSRELWNNIPGRSHFAMSDSLLVGLNADGTVQTAGLEGFNTSILQDGVSVACDNETILLLKSNGTVDALRPNGYATITLPKWDQLIAINTKCYDGLIVGLRADGTVVTSEIDSETGLYPEDAHFGDISDWKDIASIDGAGDLLAGVKTDGTVVLSGEEELVQRFFDVEDWSDIVSIDISEGASMLAGLKADGTVVTAGSDHTITYLSWTDITAIAVGYNYVVGLRQDGIVVADRLHPVTVPDDAPVPSSYEQEVPPLEACDTSTWTDIVEIEAGTDYTIGLKSDGTLVYAGNVRNDAFLAEDGSLSVKLY